MARADVNPGVCGLATQVTVQVDPMTYQAAVQISSECKHVQRLAEELGTIDATQVISGRLVENPVYLAASSARLHAACPVPCALIKAIEVAAGLALPAAVQIEIDKEA